MIAILDYNKDKFNSIIELLGGINKEIYFTLNESKIINSDKLILPPVVNFNRAYRKLQLTNIFNLLKIYKKPILSLENGFLFMINEITDKRKKGLGFFNLNMECYTYDTQLVFMNGKFQKLKNCSLSKNIKDKQTVKVTEIEKELISNYCTSEAIVNGVEFAVTSEYKNYSAIHINIKENYNLVETLIKNFILK